MADEANITISMQQMASRICWNIKCEETMENEKTRSNTNNRKKKSIINNSNEFIRW